MNKSNIFQWL